MSTNLLVEAVTQELSKWHALKEIQSYFNEYNPSSSSHYLIRNSMPVAWYNAVRHVQPTMDSYHQALSELGLTFLAGQPYNCEHIQEWKWDAKHVIDYATRAWKKDPEIMITFPTAIMHVATLRNPDLFKDRKILQRLTDDAICPFSINRQWINALPADQLLEFYNYHNDLQRQSAWSKKYKEARFNDAIRNYNEDSFYHRLDLDVLLKTKATTPSDTEVQHDILTRLRRKEPKKKRYYGPSLERYNNEDIHAVLNALSTDSIADLHPKSIERWRLLSTYMDLPGSYKREFFYRSLEHYHTDPAWESSIPVLFSQWLEWNDIDERAHQHPRIESVYEHFLNQAQQTVTQKLRLTIQQETPLLHAIGSSCSDTIRHRALYILLQQGNHIPRALLETMPKWTEPMKQLWCQWISCRTPGPLPKHWHRHLQHKKLLSSSWPVSYRTQEQWMSWAAQNNIVNISPVGLNHSLGIPLDQALLLPSPLKTSLDAEKSLALEYIS